MQIPMNMVPKKHHTHVSRASAGFSLQIMALVLALVVLVIVLFAPRAESPTDVISQTIADRLEQNDVTLLHVKPDGNVVVKMEVYGTQSVTDYVWLNYRVLEMSKHEAKPVWKVYGRHIYIKLAGEAEVGQKMDLWYIFSKKKLRNGETFEQIEQVEVRPSEKFAVGTKPKSTQ